MGFQVYQKIFSLFQWLSFVFQKGSPYVLKTKNKPIYKRKYDLNIDVIFRLCVVYM